MTMDRIDRYRGCLLGLATGGALGTALEFRPRGTFAPVIGMVGGRIPQPQTRRVDRRHVPCPLPRREPDREAGV